MKKTILFLVLFGGLFVTAMAATDVATDTQTVKEYLLGGLETNLFIACILFAGIGIVLALTVQVLFRNKYSENTPAKWSTKFLIADNWRKALMTIILVYISIVFSYQLFQVEITTWFAFLIGFGYDSILKVIKNKKQDLFAPNRDKLTEKLNG